MATTTWVLDPSHSELNFKIKHLMISSVSGKFTSFTGKVQTEEDDFSSAKINFTTAVNSINTSNEQRDAHLKAVDFFDAVNHPEMHFESNGMEKIDEDNYKLHGTLSIRGISKQIGLNVEYGGTTIDPWGGTRAGFAISVKINRKDFGLNFSMVSETGGVLLGEEVNLSAEVELVREVVEELV
ncbi:MAG: YceI family protein [Ferruginibacter sp.]